MTPLQKEHLANLINEFNKQNFSVISAIELAPYAKEIADTTPLDIYVKIEGELSSNIEEYIAEYNFSHKDVPGSLYLMIDFIGPDEAKGIPVWQKGCTTAGEVQSC